MCGPRDGKSAAADGTAREGTIARSSDSAGARADARERRGRPPQLTAEARESLILDATERVLARDGLHGASMAAIAREAGMSKRTLYTLFDGRAALFEACVRRRRASVVRPLCAEERDLPLRERLKRLLMPDAGTTVLEAPSEILRTVVAEAPRHPDLARSFLREGPHEARRVILEEIEHARTQGEIAVDDPGLAAALLCDMAYENPVLRLADPDAGTRSPAEIEARLDAAIRIFLHGTAIPCGTERADT